jgi:hypothetical protein
LKSSTAALAIAASATISPVKSPGLTADSCFLVMYAHSNTGVKPEDKQAE